jgi:small-conductance mechanosensitive channel
MDQEIFEVPQKTEEFLRGILGDLEGFLGVLLRPWVGYQLAIAAGLFLLAWGIARVARPRMHAWMRSRAGWPKWRIRILVLIHRRLRLIIFVALIWLVIWVMRDVTWPSRTYVLDIIGKLSLAWLVIALSTRLILNGLVRAVVRYAVYIWVALSILGLTEATRDLLERAAIELGETRLSLWLILQGLVVVAVLLFLARFLSRTSARQVRRNKDISPSMQELVVKVLQVVFYAAAFLVGLRIVGVDLTGLAVLSGAIGVGLGFGLQKVVSNLVSGLIILMDKSVKPGDVISIGETFGWIQRLGARYVSITTRDGKEFLIPNEDLITGQVVNWSHSNDYVRLDIYFGTAYGNDPHKVRRVAREAAAGVDRVLSQPRPPVCHIVGFGDSSVNYILRFWITDPTGGLTNIRGNVFLALWDAFKENDIAIPFPQREVTVLEGSTLITRENGAAPDTSAE